MRPFLDEDDFKEFISQRHAVIYFHVDWSSYSARGRVMLEELESSLSSNELRPVFWSADVSDLESPAAQAQRPVLTFVGYAFRYDSDS